MAEEESGGDKTEAPSARRRQRAREDGRVAVSREVSATLSLMLAGGVILGLWPTSGMVDLRLAGNLLGGAGDIAPDPHAMAVVLGNVAAHVGQLLLPVLLAAAAGSVLASVGQSGFIFHPASLMPSLGRLNPQKGIARLFSANHLVEQAKAIAKLGLFAFAGYKVLAGSIHDVARAIEQGDLALLGLLSRLLVRGVLWMLGIQLVIAALDVLWVRSSFTRSLRMSRQDLKEEHKDQEGDPHIRARIRALRRKRARQRMMNAVPAATVVLTNPTHYAVALAYEKGSRAAPKVVAKGVDEIAARIRTLARDNRVPVVANPPLARALYQVPLDGEVPNEHFRAVASVIAYVWKLAEKKREPLR